MARLRYNGLATGTVGALTALSLSGSHTDSVTTLTFNAALTHSNGTAVPTITGSDYFMLSILDAAGNVAEIVKVTAYTAAASTATVTRGQEGTTGVSHASGAAVIHGPTAAELPRTARKVANQTVTSSTTLVNDTHLLIPIAANEILHVHFDLFVSSPADAGDFKATVGVPGGATVRNTAIIGPAAGATATENAIKMQSISSATALGAGITASGIADSYVQFVAVVENGATAGHVTLQWAQATSSASGTTVEHGSTAVAHALM